MSIYQLPDMPPSVGDVWEFCGWNEPHHAWTKVVVKGVWLTMEHGTDKEGWLIEYLTLEGLNCKEDWNKFKERYRYMP